MTRPTVDRARGVVVQLKVRPSLIQQWRAALCAHDKNFLTSTQRLVGHVISVYANADGHNAYPSQETIAAAANLSVRAVQKAIATLERHGWLARRVRERPGRGGYKAHTYSLTVPLGLRQFLSERGSPRERVVSANVVRQEDDSCRTSEHIHSERRSHELVEADLDNRAASGKEQVAKILAFLDAPTEHPEATAEAAAASESRSEAKGAVHRSRAAGAST